MNKRLYVAYGSNLNIRQMKYRCPGAKLYGTGTIEDYELQFKGQPHSAFATIAPKEGSSVPVAVWEISAKNEQALDRYEGYPSHYFKKDVPVQMDGGEVTAMVYIMNQRMHFGLPSSYYYETVYEGYNDCGLDTEVLEVALRESAVQFYGSHRQHQQQQTLFDIFDSEDDEGITASDLDDGEPNMDESDPFYFSEGMHL